jgi:hypothetical protein
LSNLRSRLFSTNLSFTNHHHVLHCDCCVGKACNGSHCIVRPSRRRQPLNSSAGRSTVLFNGSTGYSTATLFSSSSMSFSSIEHISNLLVSCSLSYCYGIV